MRAKWLAPAFRVAENLLDDTLPVDLLRRFLISRLEASLDALAASPLGPHTAQAPELMLAHRLAREAGLPLSPLPHVEAGHAEGPGGPGRPPGWSERVVTSRGIVLGAGETLLRSFSPEPGGYDPQILAHLETLLRYVEVRRKAAIQTDPPSSRRQTWMEILALAVVFSRFARWRGDRRFLNAALKVNDWAYPAHRRLGPGPPLTRYLLALAEQERAARELIDE